MALGYGEYPNIKEQYTKILFFGDWLSHPSGELDCFVEIHVKRISGADTILLDCCGINRDWAFLPLLDIVCDSSGCVGLADAQNNITTKALSRIEKGELPRSPCRDMSAFAEPTESALHPIPSHSSSEPRMPGSFPRSSASSITNTDPVRATGLGFNTASHTVRPNDDTSGGRSPGSGLSRHRPGNAASSSFPLGEGRSPVAQELIHRLERLDAVAPHDPDFDKRVENSFIYAVKIVGIPRNEQGNMNMFSGPPSSCRDATLLGMGGWVVPPEDERLAYHRSHKKEFYNKIDDDYGGLPKIHVQRAMPTKPDRTDTVPANPMGDQFPPLWMEMSEPTLEDVYWMVWRLLEGQRFVGFRCGAGFGYGHGRTAAAAATTHRLPLIPFKSPSPEAMYHSANLFGRGME